MEDVWGYEYTVGCVY